MDPHRDIWAFALYPFEDFCGASAQALRDVSARARGRRLPVGCAVTSNGQGLKFSTAFVSRRATDRYFLTIGRDDANDMVSSFSVPDGSKRVLTVGGYVDSRLLGNALPAW